MEPRIDIPDESEESDEPDESTESVEREEPAEREEPDVAEVEIGDDDLGGEDLFSDVEDATSSGDESEETEPLGELDAGQDGMATTINEGAARLAVVGLDDEEREEIEDEMLDVFAAFRLGHFGSRALEEYVLTGDEEIDPAWGLLGSALCCAAVALWMRPDSDEQIEAFGSAVRNISGADQ